MTGVIVNPDSDIQWDGFALEKGYVSITPLHLKMTNIDIINELSEWNLN